MENITSLHDKYVKSNLSVKSNAVEFCKNYIPGDLLKLADFDTLKISKGSFIDEELKGRGQNNFPNYAS